MNEYITNNLSQNILVGAISLILILLLIYIPHLITAKRIKNNDDDYVSKFLTPSWIITSVWVGIVAFVLLCDGHFLNTGLANHITWAAIIMSAVTVIGSKLEHMSEFKIKKGNMSFTATNNSNKNNLG
jgi:small-conductance mechanosensitive channel